ncbi:hypothetical protein [Actinosynnema pretiosum]|uniref:hypothetical protein n=1 Tax=Actinosynnema pretiosum TaxID=42197 RepID=UPI0015A70516
MRMLTAARAGPALLTVGGALPPRRDAHNQPRSPAIRAASARLRAASFAIALDG